MVKFSPSPPLSLQKEYQLEYRLPAFIGCNVRIIYIYYCRQNKIPGQEHYC